ncbi:hypothetical protein KGP36_07420, partial [Patescibacteria group bacterium]|nr:hypothetical protein [Patescibacteria group bacterium]
FNYVFKTFDQSIKAGDIIIVSTTTRHGFTCAKVEETDVDVNFENTLDYRWIVGKVDQSTYQMILSQEEDAIAKVRAADLAKRKRELVDAILGDSASAFKQLPLAKSPGIIEPSEE